ALLVCANAFAARVHSLKITVLSTMLADEGIGEWGFAALVEADGQQILFDTGARPDTVLKNAQELKIDLSKVKEVVLSHNHGDHTGGLVTLRRELMKQNPEAVSLAHVGGGAFWSRPTKEGEDNLLLVSRPEYQNLGGKLSGHKAPLELLPGVWLTG